MTLFAEGCLWDMKKPFESSAEILSPVSGYAGSTAAIPTCGNSAFLQSTRLLF